MEGIDILIHNAATGAFFDALKEEVRHAGIKICTIMLPQLDLGGKNKAGMPIKDFLYSLEYIFNYPFEQSFPSHNHY